MRFRSNPFVVVLLSAALALSAWIPPAFGAAESIRRVRLGRLAVVASEEPSRRARPVYRNPVPIRSRDIGWSERAWFPDGPAPTAGDGRGRRRAATPAGENLDRTFFAALTRRLARRGDSVRAVRDAAQARREGCSEMVSEFAWHEGEFREVDEVRRDVVVNLVAGAAVDTLEKTGAGRFVRTLEAAVERYMTLAYRKSVFEERGRYFLPGQIAPERNPQTDALAVTAVTRLHVDSDDLAPDFTFAVLADYFHYRFRGAFNPTKGEAGLFLMNETFDRVFGIRAGIGIAYDRDEGDEVAGAVTVSGDF